MPDYLDFESKLADLKDDEASEQLRVQIERVREAINRLKESDRLSPSMLERVVSV